MKLLSCNLPDELMEQLEAEAKKYRVNKTSMTQKILELYFVRDQRQQNMEKLLVRLDLVEYEVLVLRGFIQEYIDAKVSKTESDKYRAKSKELAEKYLSKRREKDIPPPSPAATASPPDGVQQ